MTNLLSRVYNSTLGVPQQFLYRTLRALQDEDIDLLSREGILAPELMPLLGVMASHETDATVEEVFGDRGGVANFLTDMLTDPATYLTAGVTGIAKAGKSVRAAQVGGGMKKGKRLADQGIDINKFKTAGELREALHAGIQDGSLKGRAINRAARDLGEVGGNTLVKDLIESSGTKEDLLITIPGLARWGASKKAPAPLQKHKSWFALQNHLFYKKPLEKSEPVWRWMGKSIRDMGDFGEGMMDGLADLAAVPKSFRLGFSSLESAFTAKVGEFGNDELAAAKWRVLYGSAARKLQKTDIQQVVKRVREKVAAGAPLEEVVKTRGIPKELREQILKWPKSKTSPVATENIAEPLGKYLNEIRVEGKRADRILENAKTEFVRRETPELASKHWSADVAYHAGQGLRKFREFMLHRGNPDTSEWIKELQNEHLKREAQGRLILEGKQKALIERVERIAEAEGMSAEDVSRILNIHTEGSIHPLDLGATMRAIKSGTESERLAGAQHLVDIIGRTRGTVEALKGVTKLDKRTTRMLDALDSAAIDVLSSEGMHFSRHEMVRISAEQLSPKMASRFAGKRIHELSAEELDELRHTDAILDPELRHKIRKVRKERPNIKHDALVRYDSAKVTQSRRLQELDEDDLKAAIDATEDPKLRRTLRDTLRRKRQGLPPKSAFIDQQVEVPFVLGELTPEMQVLTDYMQALGDLKQGRFTSLTLERLERGTQALGRMVPEQAKAVFKKADADDIDFVFGLSDDAARLAHQANNFSMGAPLGYLPRLRNGRRERKLRKLLGDVDGFAGLKGVSSNFKKRLEQGRSLTLEEIGTKMDELEKVSPEGKKLAGELKELLEAEGLTPGKYITDHVDLMMARMGRDFDQYNSARLVDDFFGHEASMQTGAIGGRIVQLLDARHQEIKHSTKRTKFKAGNKGPKLGTKQDESVETARFMVVEQPDGSRALVDLHEVRRDKLSVELMDDSSDSVGQAFVAHQLGGAKLNPFEDARPGQWVVAGGDDMLQMFRSQVAPEPSKFADAFAAYDWVNFGLKKFQTVLRPAHHIGNLISGIFQSQAAGASAGSIAMGHHVAAQVMFGLGDAANIPKNMSRAAGFKGDLKVGRDSARMVEGMMAGKRLDDLDEVGSIRLPSGDELMHEDIWMGASESGLLSGTFARQDVKVGGRARTESVEKAGQLERLRYADDKTWQEGVTKFWDDALATTRVPEITARMSTVYALLFDGHKLEDAYELAKRAHVDYSELGIGERQILKRLIPYYTFGRKYIPWSLEQMARDPKLASQWVTGLEQSGNMGVDSNGKIVYEKGRFQADMGRMNANLDALMSVMGAAEHLLPGEVATVKGVQSVEPPAYMAIGGGGFPGVLKASIGEEGFEADSAAKALIDATFVGRLAEQAVSGEVEKLDSSLLSMVLPARFNNDPGQAALFQSNMAKRQLRRLQLMAEEATSQAEIRELREEAVRIREAILTTQQDFGQ